MPRPIDRLANANVVGVPTAAAAAVAASFRASDIFDICISARESPIYYTASIHSGLTLITLKIIFLLCDVIVLLVAADRFAIDLLERHMSLPFHDHRYNISTSYRAATYRSELQLSLVTL